MQFIDPYWLLCLLLLPLLSGLFLFRAKKKSQSQGLIAERIRSQISREASEPTIPIAFSLKLLALGLIIIAIARPYLGETRQKIEGSAHKVFILIDTSTSMLCEDVQPSRSELARRAALELIEAIPDSNIGLASFSSHTMLLSPYTQDHDSIIKSLRYTNPNIEQPSGSDLGRATSSILQILSSTEATAHSLVILSDGERHDLDLSEASDLAAKSGIRIFTIGLGTKTGGTIPDPSERDNKFRDRLRSVVYTKLDSDSLYQLAKKSGGIYINLKSESMDRIINGIKAAEKSAVQGTTLAKPNEIYAYFLLGGFILLILSAFKAARFRSPRSYGPSVVGAASLAFLCCLAQVDAEENQPTLKERLFDLDSYHKSGREMLRRGDLEGAIDSLSIASRLASGDTKAEIQFSLGRAYHSKKDYALAIPAFGEAMLHSEKQIQAEAADSIATSLFHKGWDKLAPLKDQSFKEHLVKSVHQIKQGNTAGLSFAEKDLYLAQKVWPDAIEYFHETAEMAPLHPSAKKNAETAAALLKELEEAIELLKQEDDSPPENKEKDPENEHAPEDKEEHQTNQGKEDTGEGESEGSGESVKSGEKEGQEDKSGEGSENKGEGSDEGGNEGKSEPDSAENSNPQDQGKPDPKDAKNPRPGEGEDGNTQEQPSDLEMLNQKIEELLKKANEGDQDAQNQLDQILARLEKLLEEMDEEGKREAANMLEELAKKRLNDLSDEEFNPVKRGTRIPRRLENDW